MDNDTSKEFDEKKFGEQQEALIKQLDGGFGELAILYAETAAEEGAHIQKILPPQAELSRVEKEFTDCIESYKSATEKGVSKLLETLTHLSHKEPSLLSEEVTQDLAKLIAFPRIFPEQAEAYFKALKEGASLKEMCAICDHTLKALYTAAKMLYEHQQYEDACNCFSVLTTIDAKEPLFWLALGNSKYFCGQYDGALTAYAMAAYMNPFDPMCHVYSGKCYEATDQVDLALNALDLALLVIEDNKNHELLKKDVEKERMRLSKKHSS